MNPNQDHPTAIVLWPAHWLGKFCKAFRIHEILQKKESNFVWNSGLILERPFRFKFGHDKIPSNILLIRLSLEDGSLRQRHCWQNDNFNTRGLWFKYNHWVLLWSTHPYLILDLFQGLFNYIGGMHLLATNDLLHFQRNKN